LSRKAGRHEPLRVLVRSLPPSLHPSLLPSLLPSLPPSLPPSLSPSLPPSLPTNLPPSPPRATAVLKVYKVNVSAHGGVRVVCVWGVDAWRAHVARATCLGSVFFRSVRRTAFCAACLLSLARSSLGVVNDGCACLVCRGRSSVPDARAGSPSKFVTATP